MFKPMLAKDAPADLSTLSYPQIVQPKLDGIRCTIVNGKALSRTLKEIPNRAIFNYLSRPEFEGLDGEIVVGDPSDPNAMQNTSTIVMSKSKPAPDDWTFWVFDNIAYPDDPWDERQWANCVVDEEIGQMFSAADWYDHLASVPANECETPEDVEKIEAEYLADGYEGVILRDPEAPYKFGRSGKKGPLLKLKRFQDAEAKVIGVTEKMHNANEAKTNELGRTERSTAKAGLVGTGTLGAFVCEAINGPHEGQRFQVGTGFTAAQRAALWADRAALEGQIIVFKSFPIGVKDAPRFPVFKAFRAEGDLPDPSEGQAFVD